MAEQWGLVIETVEIREVRVLSAQLFTQMHSRFRDKLRLESETSSMETEKQLAERRLAQNDALALKEREFERLELERSTEAQRLKISTETTIQTFRLDQQRLLVANEQGLHDARAVLETARKEHEAALAKIADEMKRRQIEAADTEDHTLALVRQLPAALGAMNLTDIHLGDDMLRSLVVSLGRAIHTKALDR
jgi:hypothetical protein